MLHSRDSHWTSPMKRCGTITFVNFWMQRGFYMNENMKSELIEWGVNWSDVEDRFMGNEALVEKFMLKFLNDQSFSNLTKGLQDKNAEEAFKACHTLKGVMGNLALDGFKEPVLELTELLRSGSLDGADVLYDQIKVKYDELITILKKYPG